MSRNYRFSFPASYIFNQHLILGHIAAMRRAVSSINSIFRVCIVLFSFFFVVIEFQTTHGWWFNLNYYGQYLEKKPFNIHDHETKFKTSSYKRYFSLFPLESFSLLEKRILYRTMLNRYTISFCFVETFLIKKLEIFVKFVRIIIKREMLICIDHEFFKFFKLFHCIV